MSNLRFVPQNLLDLYEVHEWRNGLAVLSAACPDEWEDIKAVLAEFRLMHSEIAVPGGRKSKVADRLDGGFKTRGWREKRFDTRIVVDGAESVSPTHEVDVFKGRVALEVEWNNKDPFYDRDLNNFRLLFDLRVVDVGVIITRCTELQRIFDDIGRGSSYGSSTTHLDKLLPRLEGGGGGGCPVVVFGIKRDAYVDDRSTPVSSDE
ncbi:BglII/BstYI family type II restriction endonuclease [Brevundimonas aveniformis]|uniref:BglII/BstYI family type II restriction endonuclease n=1 Tax=Brevundimonas aveniformis TaxID=370977 RepID=UPI002491DE09|nr:BglII/BstYI family type II restriction endonuclease [Brevundimonas aveniformis]